MEATLSRDYYGAVRKLSLFSGLWPFLRARAKLSRLLLLSAVMLCIFITQIAQLFICSKDLQCICETSTSYLLTTVAFVKLYTFQINNRKIKQLTEHLFVDWEALKTPEEHEIMKSYALSGKQFSLIYPVYCFSAVYLFMSISVVPHILDVMRPLNEPRPILLPYPGYYFVDPRKYFYYILGYAVVSWELLMSALVAHDCMFVCYVEHVCSLFAVVGEITRGPDAADRYRKRCGFLVRTHQAALEFAQELESIFTIPFAVQLLISTVGMSITLLQITKDSGYLEITRYVFYVIGQLIHLFCLSLEGQKLLDHSLRTRDKIYNSSWYEAPAKSQKLLALVMIQSLRPACLSAGKIYVFSLESFTTILQTSMSYFTVLASFQ